MCTPAVDINKLTKQAEEYDYIRFTVSDINGIAKGKVVPARQVANVLKNGFELWSGKNLQDYIFFF